ncbi:MAG: DinB family protein [bacterium]
MAQQYFSELLKTAIESAYRATNGLVDLVDDDMLTWKPETGENWMNVGQLLMHINSSCGACCKGFVTGDWGLPPDVNMTDLPPEEMLPPAEKMPTVESVAQAREMLAADKEVALAMVAQAGEDDLNHKLTVAPWDPEREVPLGYHLLGMVNHLSQHKDQLFYYLKLQGKPVNTGHLWGMAE